tara:strand:- start:162002 stop:162544 length:543 start_codon:yes stop_codon:yes gene_type:complete
MTGEIMDRSRRRELFWLFLMAGCVALFVARHERPKAHADDYDRGGLNDLVRETQSETLRATPKPLKPVARYSSNDDIITGSIARPAERPAVREALNASGYYVPLGSYSSIDQATRRYLDVAKGDPSLERDNKLRIETINVKGDATFYKVRMGNFGSAQAAKNACSSARISSSLCLVVAAR